MKGFENTNTQLNENTRKLEEEIHHLHKVIEEKDDAIAEQKKQYEILEDDYSAAMAKLAEISQKEQEFFRREQYYKKKEKDYENMMNEIELYREKIERYDEMEKNVQDLKQLVNSFEISMEESKKRGNQ